MSILHMKNTLSWWIIYHISMPGYFFPRFFLSSFPADWTAFFAPFFEPRFAFIVFLIFGDFAFSAFTSFGFAGLVASGAGNKTKSKVVMSCMVVVITVIGRFWCGLGSFRLSGLLCFLELLGVLTGVTQFLISDDFFARLNSDIKIKRTINQLSLRQWLSLYFSCSSCEEEPYLL